MGKSLPQISVEQYAGIQAALAYGIALEDALAQEGVPDWHWPTLDLEMSKEICSEPAVFEQYSEKLAEAEDWLGRPIAPLEDDVAAWTGFVGALVEDGSLADRHGMKPPDMARLQRHWQRRFEEDAKLEKQAGEIAADPPPPPDAIDVADVQLKPFPWSPGAEQAEHQAGLEPLNFLATTSPVRKGLVPPKRASPTIPFEGQSPAPPAKLSLEPNAALGQTAPLSDRERAAKPATPFEPDLDPVSKPPTPEAPAHGAVAVPLPRPMPPLPAGHALEPSPLLSQTASITEIDINTLPFAGKNPAPPPAASTLEPNLEMGQTAPLAPAEPTEPTEPAAAPESEAEPMQMRWSPEEYGRFCAQLDAVHPENRFTVLQRWRVKNEQARDEIEQRWRARFDEDPSLRARFLEALKRGPAW